MVLDAETFRWVVGGYFVGLSAVSAVAYHDPKFYLDWIFTKLALLSGIVYLVITSFWLGAKAVKDSVQAKLSVPAEQLDSFLKMYDAGTDLLQWIIIGSVVAFIWTLVLHSVSVERRKNKQGTS
ncbi:hypothetical protein [Candidatus Erwinia dacicola]|uniref:Membrane protein n=1 Tax=Candidatus Erwinia dacicola TaxID=252393 RepID=A0A328TQI3_9GAMM|nr:hypothetical protein [Candidatus Erwinia dacicola]RAP72877.1 putative membrane protein [Candidatus Erwinia dacicola]